MERKYDVHIVYVKHVLYIIMVGDFLDSLLFYLGNKYNTCSIQVFLTGNAVYCLLSAILFYINEFYLFLTQ